MFEPLLQVCQYPCTDARSRPLVWLVIFGTAWLVATWVAKQKKGGKSMKAVWNVIVVVVLVAAVGGVFALKRANQGSEAPAPAAPAATVAPESVKADPPAAPTPSTANIAAETATADNPAAVSPQALPRLVDLGSDSCIPCKMMMPVLDDLRKEYAGRLSVEFYDVRKDPSQAAKYGIRVIPTQIFFDAAGKELFRHEGFFGKDDILATWKACGVDLAGAAR
jgi:thioredoxin 1